MNKIRELPLGSPVRFKMTLFPVINAPIIQGILKKYCRVPGWQRVVEYGKKKTYRYYPVKLAQVKVLTTGNIVKIDAKGIINVIEMEVTRK